VIPATLDTALTFDEMQSKIVWTVNKILENQYLTVPYLISLGTEYTTTSISIKGILFQNYTPLQVDKEFVINGMKDGTYYINVFNDAANTEAGKPPVQSNDLLFLSTEYMPKNCTSLYVFDILNGNIVGNSIRYNDLYTEMHNADPNAHQALFEEVYNKIEEESNGLHNEIVDETNRAKQAEQQLQDNIDNESTARQQADTTLQNNINAEKTARQQADTTLQNNINAEKTARENADTALQDSINTEKTARENADTTLQNSINAEKTAREQADTALRNSLDEEIGDRIDGEDAINNKIDTHIANKNNPHNVTADQIGNVVKTINNLVNNITVNGSRGTSITNSSNTITVKGSMIDVPSDTNLDNATEVGIYALSAIVKYTTSYSGLPNKGGWLYMLVYKAGTAIKQIIYNEDGAAYQRHGIALDWAKLNYGGGGGTAGVSSINSLTGALTLNGDQGVKITTTPNAIHVNGQYYVLSQNTSINGTLRPGITAAGNYAFTNTPQNKSVMYVITVDYKSNEYIYAQYAVCFDYSIYRRLSNADGSTATAWKLSSYSPALDNQTITLDSLAPNLGIQNLTLQLEQYRGVTFKAKFYVPFAVSNSNSPLTEIALWSLPEGWAFDEDQYIPVYIRSVSSGASSFGYIQCSNNAMQLIIGGTGQSIPAGWVVRFCNSDIYLVKSGA
jgi:hypothetical protein